MSTWVGVSSLCGARNLLAAYWLTDMEVGRGFLQGAVRGSMETRMEGYRDMGDMYSYSNSDDESE